MLFRQPRVGQHGRIFELLKFRSLQANDDSDVRWSVAGDDRQTRLGRGCAASASTSCPSCGTSSAATCRWSARGPSVPTSSSEFCHVVPDYDDRHRLPVGITGWAQVNGLRGDTSIADRAMYDNHYIDDWSLLRDLSILLRHRRGGAARRPEQVECLSDPSI